MKTFICRSLVTAGSVLALGGVLSTEALAADPGTNGQPSQSCQAQPSSPPGFNTSGFANAESHYAGSQPQNSNNPNSVSQYDVACFQVSQPHP
jgi:hypothetical protein